jgi:hypothetical protein
MDYLLPQKIQILSIKMFPQTHAHEYRREDAALHLVLSFASSHIFKALGSADLAICKAKCNSFDSVDICNEVVQLSRKYIHVALALDFGLNSTAPGDYRGDP